MLSPRHDHAQQLATWDDASPDSGKLSTVPEMVALKSRGGRYQQEIVRYDTEYLRGISIRYQTILAHLLPKRIEISAKCQKIDNTTITLGSCLKRESCLHPWV